MEPFRDLCEILFLAFFIRICVETCIGAVRFYQLQYAPIPPSAICILPVEKIIY